MTTSAAKSMWVALTALLFMVAGAPMPAVAGAGALPDRFDPARHAARDVAQAVAIAKVQGKRVIVDVGGEWCSWCHILDRYIAAHPAVADEIRAHFVWVKVNFSKENRNPALLSHWPAIEGYPHLFVLDWHGSLVLSQDTGKLESGESYDEGRFIAFLDRARR
jgi:thioredoxin-related protein